MLASILKYVRSFGRDRRGNIGLMFALMAIPLTLSIGVGIDYGLAASIRTKMQAALDAAVLAGARAASTSTQSAAITLAQNIFTANTPYYASATTSFTFNGAGALTGTAKYNVAKFFGAFSGGSTVNVGVVSEASGAGSPVCILLLSTTVSPTLLVNNGANVNGANCELDSASTGNPADTFNNTSNVTMTKLCLAGTTVLNNGGTHPNLTTGCTTASNPYVGNMPSPGSLTCTGSGGNYTGGTVNLTPGVYCGGYNFNSAPTVNLAAGLYVIKGGSWNVNGGVWTGTGVTFYFADSSEIQFNGGMNMTLTAPTSGTYAGILFYEVDGLTPSPFIMNNSVAETLSGFFYLPSRNITWNSVSTVTSPQLSVIANTMTLNTMNWTLTGSTRWPITNGGSGATPALLE
ncbi:MAG: TadE/TadG family type IV pilus assembly protein [Roseiarcus sp.]